MPDDFFIPEQCRLSTSETSRELDSHTISEFGIDGFTLMEMAASGAASHIGELEGNNQTGLYLCGKGNNAGDALTVARYLINTRNHSVSIFFVLGNDDLSGDAAHNLNLLKKLRDRGAKIRFLDDFGSIDHSVFDYIVDGIFGTGLNSDLRAPLPDIIGLINNLDIPVYAMDLPSGLNADSGLIHKAAIIADYTFTFGSNKIGFYLNDAKTYTGEIVYIKLPFPFYLDRGDTCLINRSLYDTLPAMKRDGKHKYDGGVVHIMAGSEGLTGAAIMAAKSAWKQGAGSVFLYAPKKLLPVYETMLPHIIKVGLGSEQDHFYKETHAETIIQKTGDKKGVLLAGPGIGTKTETGRCLETVLKNHPGPAILDADALSFWKQIKTIPAKQRNKWLLTPHIGEASGYLNGHFSDDHERLQWASSFVKNNSCSILLKGSPAFLCLHAGLNYITGYDTSPFSRAGFGDVLSGTLAAFTSFKNNIEIAAIKSLYQGYQSYKNAASNTPFGPEHLL
jgi:ADP-dependent NAD(P)H-hydrate dehydratase / NAD(P)H-hydrate epimerase